MKVNFSPVSQRGGGHLTTRWFARKLDYSAAANQKVQKGPGGTVEHKNRGASMLGTKTPPLKVLLPT
jgi:hypothetical protein